MLLYDRRLSGHCWKVRLMLGFCGLAYERREIDILAGEARTPEFLRLSPRGEIPVLDDDGFIVWDSQAILGYLARRHAPSWLPLDPVPLAETLRWLSVAGVDMTSGVRAARAVVKFGMPGDLEKAQAIARRTIAMIETRLAGREWLVGDRPTIADVAIYPYTMLAPEAGVPLDERPAIQSWAARFAALPGYAAQEA
jgi:glutathione S-transferase